MVHTIYIEVDTTGELGRVEREVAEHRGGVLLVLPEINVAGPGALDVLAGILADSRVAVLLAGSIPEDIGQTIRESGCRLFVKPRARIGSPGISGTELSAIGAATLIQTPKHAVELLRAAWLAGELTVQTTTDRVLRQGVEAREA